MMWRSFAIFGLLVIISGLLFCLAQRKTTPKIIHSPPALSLADNDVYTSYWREEIERKGADQAYHSFVAWAQPADINQQHTLAHIMGGLLYDLLGKKGLAVCDSSFSFGCFHEFSGRAIHSEGLAVAYELNEACVTNLGPQALSCQHGIGHGIQTYLGYDEVALKEGLKQCSGLPYSDPIGGCYGGVFMEYNMRTMLALDGVGPRENDDPQYPCRVVSEEFLPACYYWQPQWWIRTSVSDLLTTYHTIGELCREAGTPYLTQKCFEGIGNNSGDSARYKPETNIAFCQAAASLNTQHELFCRSNAANSYFVIPAVRNLAPEVCAGLTGKDETYCLRHSDNTFNQLVRPE